MSFSGGPLAIVATHPVQYQAPVYEAVERTFGVPVRVIYGSDFSMAGYYDKEFQFSFAWDVNLTGGDSCTFLARKAEGGADSFEQISAKGLGQALRDCSPGAVLLTGYQPSFHLYALGHASRLGVPILFRAETTDHAAARNPLKAWARRTGLRYLYSRCDRLLPIGVRSYEHYRALGCAEEKLIFSPYCVNTAPFHCEDSDRSRLRSATREELGLAEETIAILFSGKLSPRKGPALLIEAVKRMPAEIRNRIALLFLGDGQERETLTHRAAEEPAVSARFLGFQNQRQLSRFYHAADLLTLPSLEFETWGLVVNEGLHHGLPCVVSSAVGCGPDLIEAGVTGEVAASGSADALKDALVRSFSLLKNPGTSRNCRQKVAGYTVEKAAAGIAEAYRSLIPPDSAVRI